MDRLSQGGMVVVSDMLLAVSSVVVNLMVITAIKEKESGVNLHHLLLANLCLSNLVSAVLVKSISIVHHGYVVTLNSGTHSSVAFCNIMVVCYRITWAILPWTLVAFSWLLILSLVKENKVRRCLFINCREQRKQTATFLK